MCKYSPFLFVVVSFVRLFVSLFPGRHILAVTVVAFQSLYKQLAMFSPNSLPFLTVFKLHVVFVNGL